MKNFIIYFSATILVIFGVCFSVLHFTKDLDYSKDYFLETGDSVIAKISFDHQRMQIQENGENGFSYRERKQLEINHDSVFIKESEFTKPDKYGKSELVEKFIFLGTFNEKGIINTTEFLGSVNRMQFVGNDTFNYTKITILDNGKVKLY